MLVRSYIIGAGKLATEKVIGFIEFVPVGQVSEKRREELPSWAYIKYLITVSSKLLLRG